MRPHAPPSRGVRYTALVPNLRGLERALSCRPRRGQPGDAPVSETATNCAATRA
ncbi:hypothetical protein ACTMU2_08090 [Cupriavidus basilensis]